VARYIYFRKKDKMSYILAQREHMFGIVYLKTTATKEAVPKSISLKLFIIEPWSLKGTKLEL
jgi:hypothetical protein